MIVFSSLLRCHPEEIENAEALFLVRGRREELVVLFNVIGSRVLRP